ncbi:hypothetical protein [Sulfitobacter sp. R18_1]|uniref:hypothetical protein n=1 Tax=Sulfitobacter sp. R18_1 TaxID=2821104 RepID=UPI001ADA3768|nr:hypothetical protein [Sulfitobacter sp. R18_1]MBO9427880.1 hypothetical protein [Sulfitobacter sp. R18_1]
MSEIQQRYKRSMSRYFNGTHEVLDKKPLSFETEYTPRVFEVILSKVVDYNKLGEQHPYYHVAVSDLGREDYPEMFVAFRHEAFDNLEDAQAAFQKILEADWTKLKEIYRNIAYQFGVEDLDDDYDAPEEGCAANLYDLGYLTIDDEKDIRTDDMIAADDRKDCPYTFGKIGRMTAIDVISNRQVQVANRVYLSWNFDIMSDMSLEVAAKDDPELSEDFDGRWAGYIEGRGADLSRQIYEDVIEEFTENMSTWPGDDVDGYEMGHIDGELILKSVNGEDASFENRQDMRRMLMGLPEKDLAYLYKICETLDHDIRKEVLESSWKHKVSFHRTTKEDEWSAEPTATPNM